MRRANPCIRMVMLPIAVLVVALPVGAQSNLPCQMCHPAEKTAWLAGRHANTQRDVAGELAANWAGQGPDSVINGASAENCVACHGPVAVAAGTGMTEVQVMGQFFTTTGGAYTDSTTIADSANWPHVGCVSCHNVPSDHPSTMPTISYFNSTTAHYDSMATASMVCGQCHGTLRFSDTDHRIYNGWKMSRHGHQGQEDLAGELAVNWAGQSPDSVVHGSAAENCIACHAPTSVPQKGTLTEVDVLKRFFTTTGGAFTASTSAADTAHWPDMACNGCHNPHNPGALSYYNSTTRTYQVMGSSDSLCGQCHGSLRYPETDHRSYDLERGTGAIGVQEKVTMPGAKCVDCHMGKSDIDGTNSLMFKGHRWTPVLQEPDGSTFASCTTCHPAMSADSAVAKIAQWKNEFQSLDDVVAPLVAQADSVAGTTHDTTKTRLVDEAKHNLDMAELDESGGFHNHLYSMALLRDAAARASLVTGIKMLQPDAELPARFALFQNYPNPFNPSTKIRYDVPKQAMVTLTLYDLLGREVMTLVNKEQSPGRYEVALNAQGLASGMYVYRILVSLRTSRMGFDSGSEGGNFVATRKLLLLR